MSRIAVIGSGTWGCALASMLHQAGDDVILWGRRPSFIEQLGQSRQHPRLPHHPLPPALQLSSDDSVCATADTWIWAIPTQHCRAMAARLAPQLPDQAQVVSVSKGIEQGSLLRISQVLAESLPAHHFFCLSGPSHAEEVLAGQPAGLVLAGDSESRDLQSRLNRTPLRVYRGQDVVGVELAGALKNVIAIAAGCVDALKLGDNVKATLVTRGLAEMRRLGRALGADDQTFAGLAGIGDLLTTCYSGHGRNRALGTAIASGQDLAEFCAHTGTVPEGAWTAQAAMELATKHGVELPIAQEVVAVLDGDCPVSTAMHRLLQRHAGNES